MEGEPEARLPYHLDWPMFQAAHTPKSTTYTVGDDDSNDGRDDNVVVGNEDRNKRNITYTSFFKICQSPVKVNGSINEGPKLQYLIRLFTTIHSSIFLYDRRVSDENSLQQLNLKYLIL